MKDAKPPILLTGFDAFGDNKTNPSEQLIADLAASLPEVIALPLPTSFAEAGRLAIAAIERHEPRAVVMFGLATTELSLRLEFLARNEITADQQDNDGQIRLGERIAADGPDLYASTLPLNAITRVLNAGRHQFTTWRWVVDPVANERLCREAARTRGVGEQPPDDYFPAYRWPG